MCYNVGEITSLFLGNTENTRILAFFTNNLCLSCEKGGFYDEREARKSECEK